MIAHAYGWTHKYILSLTTRQFFLYLAQVSIIENRKNAQACEVASFPYMEKPERKAVMERLVGLRQIADSASSEVVEDNWDFLRKKRS